MLCHRIVNPYKVSNCFTSGASVAMLATDTCVLMDSREGDLKIRELKRIKRKFILELLALSQSSFLSVQMAP